MIHSYKVTKSVKMAKLKVPYTKRDMTFNDAITYDCRLLKKVHDTLLL